MGVGQNTLNELREADIKDILGDDYDLIESYYLNKVY